MNFKLEVFLNVGYTSDKASNFRSVHVVYVIIVE